MQSRTLLKRIKKGKVLRVYFEDFVDLLTDLGFGPEVGPGDEVRLRTCPILDSATTNPDVICSVHHGLVEGIRGALGRDEGTVGLEPFALPGACRLTLPR